MVGSISAFLGPSIGTNVCVVALAFGRHVLYLCLALALFHDNVRPRPHDPLSPTSYGPRRSFKLYVRAGHCIPSESLQAMRVPDAQAWEGTRD